MAEAVAYPVEVKPDFVARQTKAQPVAALAELIWNALDADATEVAIELTSNARISAMLGGAEQQIARLIRRVAGRPADRVNIASPSGYTNRSGMWWLS